MHNYKRENMLHGNYRFGGHPHDRQKIQFGRRQAGKLAAARAAHVAAMIKRGEMPKTLAEEQYDSSRVYDLEKIELGPAWHPLPRLRGINTEAFYHWTRVQAYFER